MTNAYSDSLNGTIVSKISENMITELHKELLLLSGDDNFNVYDFVQYSQNKKALKQNYRNRVEDNSLQNNYNLVLKLFLQELILRNDLEHKKQSKNDIISELGLKVTPNPNYYKDNDSVYYSFNVNELVKNTNIINILDNGNYITKENIKNTQYYLIKTFDINNTLIEFSLTDKDGNPYRNVNLIANILNLKKEYVKKYKKIGYYGNSNDFFANIANFFSKPVESGYYMDSKFNFYKWDNNRAGFVKNNRDGYALGSVSLADYETDGTSKIIRTDYDGKGFIQ